MNLRSVPVGGTAPELASRTGRSGTVPLPRKGGGPDV